MIGARWFFPLIFLGLCLACARAQVEVRLQMGRTTFVAGEQIPLSVSVTNHSGQDLAFQGNSRLGWIDFTVMSGRGVAMTPLGQPAFGSVKIPLGQTMTRTVDLSKLYSLQSMGNFSVYAVVRLPGQTHEGFMSNRLLFNVNTARPYWTQKVGVPGKAGQTREYRVLEFSGGPKTMLYAQVMDTRTGGALQTHSLGEVMMVRKPSITLDNRQVMHVLYMVAPDTWGHARVSPNGTLLGRELHKRGAVSDPVLVTNRSGVVQVGNSVPYDPQAAARARNHARKISDRPAFIFQ
jgi:hypothetical protein